MANRRKKYTDKNGLPDLAGIIHDMKSPLSVIKGFIETVDAPMSEQELTQYQGAAKRSVEKLFGMIEGVLSDSASVKDAGLSTLPNFNSCDIAETMRSCLAGLDPMAFDRGVSLRYVGPGIFSATVDCELIERAVTNLVQNAIEASACGSEIRVELFVHAGDVHIKVVDGGLGIEDSIKPLIFGRGFTHGKEKGSGFGLEVCKHAAESHCGTLNVFSKKDLGSVFSMSLPRGGLREDTLD